LSLRWTRLPDIAGGDGRNPLMEGLRGLGILLVFGTNCWVSFSERWLAPGKAAFAAGDALYLVGNTGLVGPPFSLLRPARRAAASGAGKVAPASAP